VYEIKNIKLYGLVNSWVARTMPSENQLIIGKEI